MLPLFGRKAKQFVEAGTVVAGTQMATWPTVNVERLIREGYKGNVTAFSCISLAASTAAGVPWCLFERRGARIVKKVTVATAAKAWQRSAKTGDRRYRKAIERAEVEQHAALTLLENPNPDMTGEEFVEAYVSYLHMAGDSYTELVPTNRGIGEMWPLPSSRMKKVADSSGRVVEFVFDLGKSKEVRYPADEIMNVKTFNPDGGLYGMSPLQAAARSIDTANAARLWNWNVLANYGMPPGGFIADKPLAEPRYLDLKRMIRKMFSGAEHARRPLLLDAGVKWEVFSQSAAELDWLNGSKMSAREICAALRISSELIGDGENSTYNNRKEARKGLYEERTLPDLDKLKGLLNKKVAPRFEGNLFFDYDRDQIEALQEAQGELYDRLERCSFLTLNEKRGATGWDEREDCDVILVNAGMVPLAQAGQTGDDALEGEVLRRQLAPDDDDDAVARAEKQLEALAASVSSLS